MMLGGLSCEEVSGWSPRCAASIWLDSLKAAVLQSRQAAEHNGVSKAVRAAIWPLQVNVYPMYSRPVTMLLPRSSSLGQVTCNAILQSELLIGSGIRGDYTWTSTATNLADEAHGGR